MNLKTFLISRPTCLVPFLILSCIQPVFSAEPQERLPALDALWAEVSRSVREGDFEGYKATCHTQGVLVSGISQTSHPLSQALARWKQGFLDTKSGKMKASVTFRFSQRLSDATTAHETGIFLYTSQNADSPPKKDYIHFEALLVRQDEKWKVYMEYQKSKATAEEWEKLKFAPQDWPAWRGPTTDGIAPANQTPPTQWSAEQNILWKTPLPGKGHGSPTLVGEDIYLAVADRKRQVQSVLCLDRQTGKLKWETLVHQGRLSTKGHRNTSQASASVACDGDRLFINFLNDEAVHTTALDRAGKILWQQKICDFDAHQGFASSPALHGPLVLVTADHRGGGVVTGLNRKTGQSVWRRNRPKEPNYTSPVVVRADGRDQLVLCGCNLVTSLDPLTGETLWETTDSTTECVVTMVSDGKRVFASGGYPKNHMVALNADGSGTVAWQNISRVYVPSMLVKEGYVFAVLDAGFATCWNSETGEEMWKERLGGDFFSSPVMVGDRIYATNVRGKTYVFEANPKRHKLIASNQLGDEVYSSPVIVESKFYLRVAHLDDERKEFLYCIGTK